MSAPCPLTWIAISTPTNPELPADPDSHDDSLFPFDQIFPHSSTPCRFPPCILALAVILILVLALAVTLSLVLTVTVTVIVIVIVIVVVIVIAESTGSAPAA